MEGNGKQAQQRRRGEERIFTRAELERAVKRRLDEAERLFVLRRIDEYTKKLLEASLL